VKTENDPKIQAQNFLAIADQFALGELVTELPHPKTTHLSELAVDNPAAAFTLFKELDAHIFSVLRENMSRAKELATAIVETWARGGRVILVGCGATGRLSLVLETLWRRNVNAHDTEAVVAVMAGGDLALVHSIERFEDYPNYAHRQLEDIGANVKDLIIGITEGGETPFVIGAVEWASNHCVANPFFIYCNPDDLLKKLVTRSRLVLENAKIRKVNLTVGPMALAGSTRLQAASIQMLFTGLALLHPQDIEQELKKIERAHETLDYSRLQILTGLEREAERVLYRTSAYAGVGVITDTTERSPTFSLLPFENRDASEDEFSRCFLCLPEALDAEQAWLALLGRAPRAIEWPELEGLAGSERLHGFNFSQDAQKRRSDNLFIDVDLGKSELSLSCDEARIQFTLGDVGSLGAHALLKFLLNAHSTILMGQLGRYRGNLMTWVRPSNNKLIDRTVRYARILLQEKGRDIPYATLVETCFELIAKESRGTPLVLKLVERYS
jgi:N-acetylmuramic acid 6-phosphate etherase